MWVNIHGSYENRINSARNFQFPCIGISSWLRKSALHFIPAEAMAMQIAWLDFFGPPKKHGNFLLATFGHIWLKNTTVSTVKERLKSRSFCWNNVLNRSLRRSGFGWIFFRPTCWPRRPMSFSPGWQQSNWSSEWANETLGRRCAATFAFEKTWYFDITCFWIYFYLIRI